MTNKELASLLSNKEIIVKNNNIPNVPLKTIISNILHEYNGYVDFDCNTLTISDRVVEVWGHTFEWYGDNTLKTK